jgi:hypothetical protein
MRMMDKEKAKEKRKIQVWSSFLRVWWKIKPFSIRKHWHCHWLLLPNINWLEIKNRISRLSRFQIQLLIFLNLLNMGPEFRYIARISSKFFYYLCCALLSQSLVLFPDKHSSPADSCENEETRPRPRAFAWNMSGVHFPIKCRVTRPRHSPGPLP